MDEVAFSLNGNYYDRPRLKEVLNTTLSDLSTLPEETVSVIWALSLNFDEKKMSKRWECIGYRLMLPRIDYAFNVNVNRVKVLIEKDIKTILDKL